MPRRDPLRGLEDLADAAAQLRERRERKRVRVDVCLETVGNSIG